MTIAVFSDFDNPYDGLNATALLFKAVCKMTLAPEKTQTIPLQESSQSAGRTIPELEYLGVVIQGWFRKLDGTWSFGFKCSPSALKAFRRAIKADTPKTHTLSLESLIDRVNLIILGKAAYWTQAAKAVHPNLPSYSGGMSRGHATTSDATRCVCATAPASTRRHQELAPRCDAPFHLYPRTSPWGQAALRRARGAGCRNGSPDDGCRIHA